MTLGKDAVIHGMKTKCLVDEKGNPVEAYSISAGLDYPAVGPEHVYLREIGRAKYVPCTDDEAVEAFKILCRIEGIIPAIESSHAVSGAMKYAKELDKDDYIIVTLSGRGDKDVAELMEVLKK